MPNDPPPIPSQREGRKVKTGGFCLEVVGSFVDGDTPVPVIYWF